jgi:uncharacterized protein
MSDTREFLDLVEAPSETARTITSDGYLVAPAVLARAGVFKYRAAELGLSDRKPDELVTVYRSQKALADAVESFESQTITLDHKWTSAANWRANAIGDVREVSMRDDDMIGTLIVRDQKAIRAIEGGRSQLSNGYRAAVVHNPGKYRGQSYEYEQTNFVGNHIAVVDRARCGTECRIADSEPTETVKPMITRMYDGLSASFENEQSAQVFDRVLRSLDEANKQLDALRSATPKVKLGDKELDAAQVVALIDCKCQEIEALKKKEMTPEAIQRLVVERSNAIAAAKDMMPDIKVGDSDTAHTIRVTALDYIAGKDATAKSQLEAAFGSQKLADAEPRALEVAFATIAAGLKRSRDAQRVKDSRSQIARVADAAAVGREEKDERQAFIERQQNAWKGTHQSKEVN